MADQKISQLTALTTPANADLVPIVDDTDSTTKKITWQNLLGVGSTVQAYDANLTTIAGLTPASSLIIGDGLGDWTTVTPSNFITDNNILDTGDFASIAETDTGTSTTKALTPDGLAGSNYGEEVVQILVFDDSQDVSTGNGAGDVFFRIPSKLNGWNLVEVAAQVQTAGTTGTTDIQIHNVTDAADMLSTVITIDTGETDSSTAATPAAINGATDDVATGDSIRIDVDAVSTTAPKGLLVELTFRLP